jgi:dienelactone hydrolase
MKTVLFLSFAVLHLTAFSQSSTLTERLASMAKLDQIIASNSVPPAEYAGMSTQEWNNYKDSVFRAHGAELEQILDEHGYPGFEEVGQLGEFHFWLLAQHCDHDTIFQKRVLDSMRIHVEKLNCSATNYAYLNDRYQVNTGKKQLYGTQVTYSKLGKAAPKNLKAFSKANALRKEIAMKPLEYYLNEMSIQHYNMNETSLNSRGILAPSLYMAANDSLWMKGKLLSKNKVYIKNTSFFFSLSDGKNYLPQYAYLDSLEFFKITYQSDNEVVQGFSIEPKYEKNIPVIIFNRGGNRIHGRLTVKSLLHATSKLASQGYMILASNYRDSDEFGGADIQDVLSLIHLASEFEKADTTKIGMFGWSRGGMMTYLAVKHSKRIQTAVVGNGVSNLFESIENRPEMEKYVYSKYMPDYWLNKEEELRKRSVCYWVDELDEQTTFLLLCGTNDQRVNPAQSKNLAYLLTENGRKCMLREYPTGHSFRGYRDELNAELIQWFKDELR